MFLNFNMWKTGPILYAPIVGSEVRVSQSMDWIDSSPLQHLENNVSYVKGETGFSTGIPCGTQPGVYFITGSGLAEGTGQEYVAISPRYVSIGALIEAYIDQEAWWPQREGI